MDPEAEREAWKEHFRKIQEHREVANGRVWQNVAPSMGVAHWLAVEPTDAEISECGRSMKNGKAAGVDGFLAEFYKYGSQLLVKQINGDSS